MGRHCLGDLPTVADRRMLRLLPNVTSKSTAVNGLGGARSCPSSARIRHKHRGQTSAIWHQNWRDARPLLAV